MIASGTIVTVISTYGIAILAPLAILEGPIVTIVAGYLASIGLLSLWQVILCVIVADLVGDFLLYAIGRGMLHGLPAGWRARLGLSDERLARFAEAYATNGVRVLVVGKLTHAAGFAILLGAGAARMPLLTFFLANLLATIPKSLALVALGYAFGSQHARIAEYLSVGSVVVIGVLVAGLAFWVYRKRAASA
jgi:membrane-associated protein